MANVALITILIFTIWSCPLVPAEKIVSLTNYSQNDDRHILNFIDELQFNGTFNKSIQLKDLASGNFTKSVIQILKLEKAMITFPNPRNCSQSYKERDKNVKTKRTKCCQESQFLRTLYFTQALFSPKVSCGPSWSGVTVNMAETKENLSYSPYFNFGGNSTVRKNETLRQTVATVAAGDLDNWALSILVDYFIVGEYDVTVPNKTQETGRQGRNETLKTEVIYFRAYMQHRNETARASKNESSKPERKEFVFVESFNSTGSGLNDTFVVRNVFHAFVKAIKKMTAAEGDILLNILNIVTPNEELVSEIKKMVIPEKDVLSSIMKRSAPVQQFLDAFKKINVSEPIALTNSLKRAAVSFQKVINEMGKSGSEGGSGWATSSGMIFFYVLLLVAAVSGSTYAFRWLQKRRHSTE